MKPSRPVLRRADPRVRGAIPTVCNQGVHHQSKLEATRCNTLHLMQQGNLISELEAHPQPIYRLEVNGVLITTYRADFRYRNEDGALVVEDTKGWETEIFKLKERLMKAIHDIVIEKVRRDRGVQ